MTEPSLSDRYELLKAHVGWTARDAALVHRAWPMIEPVMDAIVEDFYQAIASNPATSKVITGGAPQVQRLQFSLRHWLRQAFTATDDRAYLQAQRQIGKRHVALGLAQCFANVAMSRLRTCLCRQLHEMAGEISEPIDTMIAISRRLDLDLALMEEAYQDAFVSQQQPVNQSRLRQQRAIVELSHRALSAAEISPLLEYAVLLAADVLSADQCAVLEYRESSREFAVRASFGMQLSDPAGIRVSAADHNLASEILRTRELCLVEDSRDADTVPVTPVVRHEQVVTPGELRPARAGRPCHGNRVRIAALSRRGRVPRVRKTSLATGPARESLRDGSLHAELGPAGANSHSPILQDRTLIGRKGRRRPGGRHTPAGACGCR